MMKYLLLTGLIASQTFCVGLKPSFDFGFGVRRLTMSYDEEYEDPYKDTYTTFRFSTTLPYSKIIGMNIELLNLSFFDETSTFNFGGGEGLSSWFFGGLLSKIGLIEMVPSAPVAPFFKQFFMIDHISFDGGDGATTTNLGLGFGAEFMSNKKVRPLAEASISFGTTEFYGDMNITDFGLGLGLKIDL